MTATATLEIGAGTQTSTRHAPRSPCSPPSPAVIARVRPSGHPVGGADVLAILADGRRISATTGGDGGPAWPGSPTARRRSTRGRTTCAPAAARSTVRGRRGHGRDRAHRRARSPAPGSTSHRDDRAGDRRRGHRPARPRQQRGLQLHGPHRDRRRHVSLSGEHVPERHRLRRRRGLPELLPGGGGGGGGYYAYPSFQGGVPLLQWLVIPARVGFLKEFFEISMVVQNLAGPEFTLRGGTASLDLPGGLALAPTATPQQASVALPDIPGGGDAATSWIVRGDAEGDYAPRARYAATLKPIDLPVTLEARLADAAARLRRLRDEGRRRRRRPLRRPLPGPRPRRHPQRRAGHDLQRRAHDPGRGREGLRRPAAAAALVDGREHRRRGRRGSPTPPATPTTTSSSSRSHGHVDLTQSFIAGVAGEQADGIELRQHPQVQPAAQAPELTASSAAATGSCSSGSPARAPPAIRLRRARTARPSSVPRRWRRTTRRPRPRSARRSPPARPGADPRRRRHGRGRALDGTAARTVLRHPTAEVSTTREQADGHDRQRRHVLRQPLGRPDRRGVGP